MASAAPAPPLAPVTFIPTSRDRTTPLLAAAALLALTFVPWGGLDTPAALTWALSGAHPKWPAFAAAWALGPVIAATLAALAFATFGNDRAASIVAALGVGWGFAQGFIA